MDIRNAKIYVGTYHKYNSGSIEGGWIQLDKYNNEEEFYEACKELHKDEEDPEFMFQDWENIPNSLINESWLDSQIFEIIDYINENNHIEYAFNAYLDNIHCEGDNAIKCFENSYIGYYGDIKDYTRELFLEYNNIDYRIINYIDWDAVAIDYGSDYSEYDGYIFQDY